MLLTHKAQQIEALAEQAWGEGLEEEGLRLDAELGAVWKETSRRLTAAQTLLGEYDEDAQESGRINAEDTPAWSDGPTFRKLAESGEDILAMPEYWEIATESAQVIAESRDY